MLINIEEKPMLLQKNCIYAIIEFRGENYEVFKY